MMNSLNTTPSHPTPLHHTCHIHMSHMPLSVVHLGDFYRERVCLVKLLEACPPFAISRVCEITQVCLRYVS